MLFEPTTYDTEYISYQKFKFASILDGIVEYGWMISCKSKRGQLAPDIHIPDGLMEVIFVIDGTYEKAPLGREKDVTTVLSSCIIGLQTESKSVLGRGKYKMVGIKFTAYGFYQLFGNQMSAFKNENIPVEVLKKDWLERLNEEIQGFSNLSLLPRLLSHRILQQLKKKSSTDYPDCFWPLIGMIEKRKGLITVEDVCQKSNRGIRQLQRYFSTYLGISPKQYLGLIRFKHFYRDSMLCKDRSSEYLDYGYYDQSHFIKDFRRRTGATPAQMHSSDFIEKNKITSINLL